MIDPSSPSERLKHALADPSRGVLGLVDELLAVFCQRDLRLDWRADLCRVSLAGGGPVDRVDVALPKSVIRAALARVAALCNEHQPNSVSPFGGQGEVVIGAGPSKAIRAVFVNTPDRQSLELAFMPDGWPGFTWHEVPASEPMPSTKEAGS